MLALVQAAVVFPFPVSLGENRGRAALRLGQTPETVLNKAIENEQIFSEGLTHYRFHEEARVESFAPIGNYVSGKMEREADINVESDGRWSEWITRFPASTLTVGFSPRALENYGVGRPFPVTPKNRDEYEITFTRREKVDDIDTLVFGVSPKFMAPLKRKTESGKKIEEKDVGEEGRAFEGSLWIDEKDAAVLKVKGKHVPELKKRYPVYETLRQPVDQFYFPAYTFSDDTLHFEKYSLRLRATINYSEFKKKSRGRLDTQGRGDKSLFLTRGFSALGVAIEGRRSGPLQLLSARSLLNRRIATMCPYEEPS